MFVQANNLQMIVRAHECVMDGFERFAQGHLITLFSATNYCGTANNAGDLAQCSINAFKTLLLRRLCLHHKHSSSMAMTLTEDKPIGGHAFRADA